MDLTKEKCFNCGVKFHEGEIVEVVEFDRVKVKDKTVTFDTKLQYAHIKCPRDEGSQ